MPEKFVNPDPRSSIYAIRIGRSKLDHSTVPTMFVANVCSNVIDVTEQLIAQLHYGQIDLANKSITHLIQRLARLQEAINK